MGVGVTTGEGVGAGVAVGEPAGVGVTPGVGLMTGGSWRIGLSRLPAPWDAGAGDPATTAPATAADNRIRITLAGRIAYLPSRLVHTTCHRAPGDADSTRAHAGSAGARS